MTSLPNDTPRPGNTFTAARGAANRWRGECIGLFAEVEQSLSTVLIRAQYVPAYAALKPAFPHLVGQKFERIRKLLSLGGPMQQHSTLALAALDAFALHDELRTTLCHGELEVGITENESRLFLFKTRNLRNKVAGLSTTAFSQSEAESRRNELQAAAAAMKTALAMLEKTLPRVAPAKKQA